MRVLHVCHSDSVGGAAIAARRLHLALLDSGVDSRMMVILKSGEVPYVDAPLGLIGRWRVRAARFVSKRIAKLAADYDKNGMRTLGVLPSGLGRAINQADTDVVHLHWVGSESLSLSEIAKIKKPIVWTLHDMWPFSGAHHLSELPAEYMKASASESRKPHRLELWMRARKERLWRDLNVHFVCPSNWMAREIQKNACFGSKKRTVIPNTLDIETFKPSDPDAPLDDMKLRDKPLLLFGAVGGASDPVKGGDFLRPTLKELRRLGHDPALAVFGGPAPDDLAGESQELGALKGDVELAQVYNRANVFVCPSRIESLSNTILEAQCCGIPAVGFGSAGQVDALNDPARTADPFDCTELAKVIAKILSNPPNPMFVRQQTIDRVGPKVVAEKHLGVYQSQLGGG